MLELGRILCPVDFSAASRHAWDHAVVIAAWYEASITALHVCDPVFPTDPPILLAEFPKTMTRLSDGDRNDCDKHERHGRHERLSRHRLIIDKAER